MRARIAVFVFGALFSISGGAAEKLYGVVVGVSDGDTVKLLIDGRVQRTVRVAGIDAPEKGQPFGQAAKKRLSDLVYRQAASASCFKVDRYGRVVCELSIRERDVGLRLVQEGMAWHFKRYQNEQSRETALKYAEAEESARRQGVGLWREPRPVAPWDWRDGVR